MSQRLDRFWSAIEQVPDLAAVPGEWCSLLGDEYALVGRFLLPTRRIARSVRSVVPGRTCIHEIRHWKHTYISVCPDRCETTTLPRDEVVIHRLDTASLAREIAESFGLESLPAEVVPNLVNVWRIGHYVPLAGFRFPVCLTLTGEPEPMRCAIDGLATRREPFVLLTPTRSHVTHLSADLLKRADSCFLPLNELLGAGDDDRLALMNGHTVDTALDEFRAARLPQPRENDGMMVFPTPSDARWEDVSIRFTDRHSVYVTVKGTSGTFHFAQMGMANKKNAKPTVQWLLLETFAEGHGILDWQNRKADRRNQKRKENLAADLHRFFRVNGDPFVVQGNGWRARFSLVLRD